MLPEVAFAGRSNVGKSSLLNVLLRRRRRRASSKTPGRTREINFFRVNDAFVLVDLPGYGYARVAKERKAEWRPLIEGYLQSSPNLRGLVLLLDSRHEPSDDDRDMLAFLAERETPVLIAITKMDKFGTDAGRDRVAAIASALELDPDQVVPVSARDRPRARRPGGSASWMLTLIGTEHVKARFWPDCPAGEHRLHERWPASLNGDIDHAVGGVA